MIAALSLNNKKIESIKNQYAKAIKSAQERQGSEEMNQILLENATYQQNIKNKLEDIKAAVKKAEEKEPVTHLTLRTSPKQG